MVEKTAHDFMKLQKKKVKKFNESLNSAKERATVHEEPAELFFQF